MKALPRGGKVHGETVCCAGVTPELEWRRQYPIRFRHLKESKFQRWQWIEYKYRLPKDDSRPESRYVQEGSIVLGKILPKSKRPNFLNSLIRPSVEDAAKRGQSLTLIRPQNTRFKWRLKKPEELEKERQDYIKAASQKSFLDDEKTPLEPCPYEFSFDYSSEDGKTHKGICHDWETSAMYWRFSRSEGEKPALDKMGEVFNEKYPEKGMVFAMGTNSRRPKQWLLNGVILLDETGQLPLL
ncbi:MAG: hypothetical protein HOL37_04875 [Rhodospirillaceae bacterium]|nr:hypothetical protein [Rhodospirillaceae bacterium]